MARRREIPAGQPTIQTDSTEVKVDALGVTTISRGCFERCCNNKKTPPYQGCRVHTFVRRREGAAGQPTIQTDLIKRGFTRDLAGGQATI